MDNDAAPSSPADMPAPDTRSYAALRIPGSRTYLMFSALAMMADSIEHVISYWMIFDKFQSPTLAGFAVIAHWVPFLLFSIWAGSLADRFDPRRIIQIGMGLFMLVSFGWGVLFLTGSLERWHAVVLLILHGFAGVLWSPASQILLHDIVGTQQLQSAIRLLATFRTLGFLLGPAIGALLLKVTGPSLGILINVLIYVPLVVWLINNPRQVHTEAGPSAKVVAGFSEMIATVRQISAMPLIFAMTALAALAATFIGNAHDPQMPEFARDLGHGEPGLYYGMLLTAAAFGAITAGIILESRSLLAPHPRTAFMLALGWSCAMFGFAVSQSYALSFVLLACAGFLDLSFNAMTRTLVQLKAPVAIRGRAIGLFNVGSLGCRTFSGITVGFGGGLIGIHWSLALSALALLLSILLLYRWAEQEGGTRMSAQPS
jgi:MFS family permease